MANKRKRVEAVAYIRTSSAANVGADIHLVLSLERAALDAGLGVIALIHLVLTLERAALDEWRQGGR